MSYQEHTTLPEHRLYVWDGEKSAIEAGEGLPCWSGSEPPPSIGDEIVITHNDCGPAVVTGYFTEWGWLGLLVRLTAPPEWIVKQNKHNTNAHVFGPEFERAPITTS